MISCLIAAHCESGQIQNCNEQDGWGAPTMMYSKEEGWHNHCRVKGNNYDRMKEQGQLDGSESESRTEVRNDDEERSRENHWLDWYDNVSVRFSNFRAIVINL